MLVGKMPSEPEESSWMVPSPSSSHSSVRALPVTRGPRRSLGHRSAPCFLILPLKGACGHVRGSLSNSKGARASAAVKVLGAPNQAGPSDAWEEGGGRDGSRVVVTEGK